MRVLSGAVPRLARDAARAALDPWVRSLSRELVGEARGLDAAARLLSAVQGRVRFERDPAGREVFRSPRETWERGAGDCDDSAVLLASLASAAGLPAELVPMGSGGAPTHVVARVLGQWAETTLRGAGLGEHPAAALARLGAPAVLRALPARRGRGLFRASARARAILGELSPALVQRTNTAAGILTGAWEKQMGRPPSKFELLWSLVWSRIDTSWGAGWNAPCADPEKCGCACSGSHNWGAVHATGSQPSCPWADRYPNGKTYCVGIRVYPDDVTGAADFVRHLVVLRPDTGAALRRVASVHEVLKLMIAEKYFGGFCPSATGKGLPTSSPECKSEAADLALIRARAEINIICAALGWPKPRMKETDAPVSFYGKAGGGGAGGIILLGAAAAGGFVLYRHLSRPKKAS